MFDLDDTLYEEREFVKSGFVAVSAFLERLGSDPVSEQLYELFANGVQDPFTEMLKQLHIAVDKATLLKIYRGHEPQLSLGKDLRIFLKQWRSKGQRIGILTDGRSLTQRKKIRALGLDSIVDEVVISEEFGSEKPEPRNYLYFENQFPNSDYVYVGDNLTKDFITPNRLGWTTVCVLDRGNNIHSQCFDGVSKEFLPQYLIHKIA